MATAAYIEACWSRKRREYLKEGKWHGERVYHVPTGVLNDNLALLRVLGWSVNGITMTPRYMEVDEKSEEAPGAARVTLLYSFADNPDAYQDGRAVLSILGYGVEEKLKYGWTAAGAVDLDQPIETEPDKEGFFWRVVEGSNVYAQPEGKYILRLAVAQSSINWGNSYNAIWHTNAGALVVGGQQMAAVGELLLTNVEIPEYFTWDADDAIVPLRYTFTFRKGGFSKLKSQKFRKELLKEYVYHESDDPIGWEKWIKDGGDPCPRIFCDKDTGDPHTGTDDTGDTPPADSKWRIASTTRAYGEAKARVPFQPFDMSFVFNLAAWPG